MALKTNDAVNAVERIRLLGEAETTQRHVAELARTMALDGLALSGDERRPLAWALDRQASVYQVVLDAIRDGNLERIRATAHDALKLQQELQSIIISEASVV